MFFQVILKHDYLKELFGNLAKRPSDGIGVNPFIQEISGVGSPSATQSNVTI